MNHETCSYCGVKFHGVWDKTQINGENCSFELCSECFCEIERNRNQKTEEIPCDSTILIARFGDKIKLFVNILIGVIKNYFRGTR